MKPCISVEGTIQEVKAKDYSTRLAYLYTSKEHSLPESHQHVFTMRLCNGLALVATVTRWLKATGSLDDLKEMKRCLGSGTRLVYYLILLNLKVLST